MLRSQWFGWLVAGWVGVVAGHAMALDARTGSAARLATFEASSGDAYFALSLQADVKSLAPALPPSVVILLDTSASQTGQTRIDSLAIVRELVNGLPADAKVAIAACDIETHDLSGGLRGLTSGEVKTAFQKLEERLPLGTTDLEAAFRFGCRTLRSEPNASIVYIGDGIARSHVLNRDEFKSLIVQLVESKISVTSLALGPVVNVEGLAVIANHTGGRIFVRDNIQASTQQIGQGLALAATEPVFWVKSGQFPEGLDVHFPKIIPPLRSDRDSVLIGVHPNVLKDHQVTVALEGQVNGVSQKIEWQVTKEINNLDFGFLQSIVTKSKTDEGLYLPTAGSDALQGLSTAFIDSSRALVSNGRFALQSGDTDSAFRLADEALARDPNNAEAQSLRDAAQQKKDAASLPRKTKFIQTTQVDIFGTPVPAEVTNVPESLPSATQPAPIPMPTPSTIPAFPSNSAPMTVPSVSGGSIDGLSELASAGDLLSREEGLRRLRAEEFATSTRARLQEAEASVARDPVGAEGSLKLLLNDVRRASDLEPGVRARLEATVRSSIETASRKSAIYRDQAARVEEVAANASATERILAENERNTAAVQQLVERFNALLTQQLYEQANSEIAPVINELMPLSTIARMVEVESSLASNYRTIQDLVYEKRRGFIDSMLLADKAGIPFADEPPVVYPPADVWRALSAKRLERYGSIDISAGTSPNEKRIYDSLKTNIKPEFSNTPLRTAIDTIATEKQIPIILDTVAMEGGTATPEDPITLTGIPEISLRSALRLMLDPLELTYVIEDEVMKITTKENGKSQVLRIYPVGDLVIPVLPPMGGGGGGGGMGGGMGGGGMGGGGMGGMGGGGMGGGGMGGMGGGGGGMFAVSDEPSKTESSTTTKVGSSSQAIDVVSATELLDKILATVDPQKRERLEQDFTKQINQQLSHAKSLLARGKASELKPQFQIIIDLVSLALRKGVPQPWMYEALSLSMQVCEYPASDIRRVLLSAVDFSGDVEDAIKIGKYLAKHGMQQEALLVLRDAARCQPLRADIYELALPLAIQLQDVEAIKWTCIGVLSQAWPDDQMKLVETAELAAKSTLIRMTRDSRIVEAKIFEDAVKNAMKRDLVVRVSWTGKADLDVSVEEPSGTICSLSNSRTLSGGVLLNDGNSNMKTSEEGYSETYACPQGFSGEYRILVEKIWGEVAGGKVTVDILTDYGTPDQSYRREQIPIAEKDALIKVAVKSGHRETPMVDIAIAKSQAQKLAASRAVLAQQIGDVGGNNQNNPLGALLAGLSANAGSGSGNNSLFSPFRGAVGYRPIITTLSQGMTWPFINAVISGDRRYVRFGQPPVFSDIVQIDTFNFVTGGGSTTGGGLGGGGGGGGGFGGGGSF